MATPYHRVHGQVLGLPPLIVEVAEVLPANPANPSLSVVVAEPEVYLASNRAYEGHPSHVQH